MKRNIVLTLLALGCSLLLPSFVAAQENSKLWHVAAHGSILFGASTPLPVPQEVKAVYTWYPKLNPSIGVTVARQFGGKYNDWGLYSGISCEFKGMEATTMVRDLAIAMGEGEDVLTGSFSGDNLTMIRNGYLTFPLGVSYKVPTKKFSIQAGLYASLLLQGSFKVIIDGAMKNEDLDEPLALDLLEFDFSDRFRPMDFGASISFATYPWERVGFTAGLNIGLISIVRKDFNAIPFKLHNVFGSVGITYRLSD